MRKVFSGLFLLIILVGTLTVAFKIQPVSADSVDWWPMFRHDLTHTGYSTSQALTTNHTLWNDTIDPMGTELSSPAVVGGIVYVGSGVTGNVYALDAMTGSRIWNYTTGSLGVASSPAVVGGVVYVGSVEYNYNVYALNATTGAPIWIYPTGDRVQSSAAVAGGVVYIGSDDGYIYALNATTGALIWKNEDSGGDLSSPAIVGGVVYVGSDIGDVLALNAATGAKIWNYTTGSNVNSSPAVVGGVVYVGSDDNNVYALNATTGAKMWNYTTGGWVFSSPAVVGGVVYVGSGDRNVYALNSSTGILMWNFTTGEGVASSPTVAGGVVYVGSEDHKLYALNATTGGLIWSFLTGSLVDTSPTVAQGLVFATSDDGNIYAFSGFLSLTSVICSPGLVSAGSHVNCSATVSGSNPTGNITWSTSSIAGSFSQSICTLSNGTCSTTYTDNFTGSVTIAAYYSGDPNNMPGSGSTTLLVTSSGPIYYSQNYTSVQAAINSASPGGTVVIAPGFYTESLFLNKTLTIIGEKDSPVFGGGSSAIYLILGSGASGSTVTGIEITNWAEGILVDDASNVRIYGNVMASIGSSGIVLDGSSATGNVVSDNVFLNTPTPINLTNSAGGNTIYGNYITSQTSVALNIGANGNVVYGNSMSGTNILLNMTNSNGNIFYHNNFLAAAQLTILATGNNIWNNSYPSGGNYWSNYAGTDTKSGPNQDQTGSDGIGDTPYTIGVNNTDHYPLMTPWTAVSGHCVAVIGVVAAKTVVGQGFNCNLTVCAADNGNYTESFSVTAYANVTGIGTQQVSSLSASCQIILRFGCNTAGLAYGNYTLSAYAQPVAGQTGMSGINFTLGTIKITIPGDINGDFKVSLVDLVYLANAYGTTPASGGIPGVAHAWNPNADINGNGIVDLTDLVLLALHYGQHYP